MLEVNHSPPSSVKIKEEWSYTSSSPVCLRGVVWENFASFRTMNPFLCDKISIDLNIIRDYSDCKI
jgi:hypothetical protein